jgi:NAD(P)-dependent dehydrogenase (short-subunit alcohol dehydrogenase family)
MGAFEGKVAFVTGAASGIGKATAERLAGEGATVLVADLDADAGERVAADIGGRFVHLDVSDPAAWDSLVSGVLAETGPPVVAHLNAGVGTGEADVAAITDAQYRLIMGANVDGVVFGTRALAPLMASAGGGAIVATASLAGLMPYPPDPVYAATKHFVVGFVRSVAPTLHLRGVTINAVCPSLVDTPLLGDGRTQLVELGVPLIPPSEIADAVVLAATSGSTGLCYSCHAAQPPVVHEFTDPFPVSFAGATAVARGES